MCVCVHVHVSVSVCACIGSLLISFLFIESISWLQGGLGRALDSAATDIVKGAKEVTKDVANVVVSSLVSD